MMLLTLFRRVAKSLEALKNLTASSTAPCLPIVLIASLIPGIFSDVIEDAWEAARAVARVLCRLVLEHNIGWQSYVPRCPFGLHLSLLGPRHSRHEQLLILSSSPFLAKFAAPLFHVHSL